MQSDLILEALNEGALRLEGQFKYGSNYTFLVTCQHRERSYKAVYKPLEGERPLWDFPQKTLARREVAAYLISEALGWHLVPTTVFRVEDAPMGPGSLQLFIEHDPNYHYFNFQKSDQSHFPMIMAFDWLINNADRKGGHLLVDTQGKLWLIDHGISFHVEDKLRTVIWDHAGEPIPPKLLSDIKKMLPSLSPGALLKKRLQPHLLPMEIEAFQNRAEYLLKNGVFPLPPEDRRAYPWPLV